ncbi:MAG: hypothetical protein ACO1SV_04075 [Fimbriimonas sp.]
MSVLLQVIEADLEFAAEGEETTFPAHVVIHAPVWPAIVLRDVPLLHLLGARLAGLRAAEETGRGEWEFPGQGTGLRIVHRKGSVKWTLPDDSNDVSEPIDDALEAALKDCRRYYQAVRKENAGEPAPPWLEAWAEEMLGEED